ncbi:MAG TPA: alpha/beta fold hydrolase [Thermoanaerobaculia bacterium]|nr:alpha/beta fold hydrolase [Thermoanaerobaculia bacterium]
MEGQKLMRKVRVQLSAAAGFVAAATVFAQPVDFVYQRDYDYQRLIATRVVHDAEDNGPIQLVTHVWKPLKNDRRELAFFMHGSTGGMATAPSEPPDGLSRPTLQFFVSRGYTVVFPLRRGRSGSTGTYVEECSTRANKCTPKEQIDLTARGLREASLDNDAVLEQLVLDKLVPRDAKILLAGHSRGGFLALLTAGERPGLVKAVINFAGAWINANDQSPLFQERVDLQAPLLSRAAKKFSGPTMWIYTARDPNYNDRFREALHKAWRDGGGAVDSLYIAEHSLPNPHLALQAPALWDQRVDAFLAGLDRRK